MIDKCAVAMLTKCCAAQAAFEVFVVRDMSEMRAKARCLTLLVVSTAGCLLGCSGYLTLHHGNILDGNGPNAEHCHSGRAQLT